MIKPPPAEELARQPFQPQSDDLCYRRFEATYANGIVGQIAFEAPLTLDNARERLIEVTEAMGTTLVRIIPDETPPAPKRNQSDVSVSYTHLTLPTIFAV